MFYIADKPFAWREQIDSGSISNPDDNPIQHALYREATGRPPGGYGILLSRHLVDELVYNETGNEVLLVKYLDRSSPSEVA